MRKWNKKSKHAFLLFAFLVVVIIALFVYSIINLMSREPEHYTVTRGSYFYNNESQLVTLATDADVTKHWTGNYYLIDAEENQYNLGKTSAIYDPSDYKIKVFGEIYQVYQDTTVQKYKGMTEVMRNVGSLFYKLEDRKYLLVSSLISNVDQTETFQNYLIVELDKNGNALLMNHETQKKTLHAMVLQTNEYRFDIANEKLYWGTVEIDLKKVGGSSNEYKEIEVDEPLPTPTVTPTPAPTMTPNVPQIDISTGGNINGDSNSNQNSTNTIMKFTRLREVTPSITYVDVSYQVFDPQNEYISVYLTVSSNNEEDRKILINKEETSYRILGLSKNQEYTITLSYTTMDELSSSPTETVQDMITVKTSEPTLSLKVTRISATTITYELKQDNRYQLDQAEVQLYVNGILTDTQTVDLNAALSDKGFQSTFIHNGLGREFELRLANTSYNGMPVDHNLYTKYINR